LKRTASLPGGEAFQRVWDNGKSWTHSLVVLRARPNGLSHNRFGFVVGKKIGNAVARNRRKRWMREAVRQRAAQLEAGWDLVFIARSKTESAFQDFDRAVGTVIKNARLLVHK